MSDFTFNKKEKSRGIYGKRTTLYDNYVFNEAKDEKFYKDQVFDYNKDAYNREDAFWEENRMEAVSKYEKGVYKVLDTLTTVGKFKRLYNFGSILASCYVELDILNVD